MSRCAILGASGHGKVIADMVELSQIGSVEFFDERWPELTQIESWSVVGDTQKLLSSLSEYDSIFVAIGNNHVRKQKLDLLLKNGAKLPALIHPSAVVSKYCEIGDGSVVMAHATVNPFSRIGKGCIINTSSSIDHDCWLGDAVHISPGAHLAGGVNAGALSWLGIGCCVKQQIYIGQRVTVGAGATVVSDVMDDLTVIGTPAKPVIE
ncbi:acetyltransferase [Vibrio sp. YMD68]|uniref:acetyltransferase n=1 Tax=Vibrio sp. YMD68 TaxID=3042300 RepID=UPI00249A1555|nr:acetyltransferase [Vibrio sp. YMD68]WGW00526.1 acetyltransferase [Vibrio sp. YMD68]